MCEHCGCRQNPAIGQLMDEHDRLLTQLDTAQRALLAGDGAAVTTSLSEFAALLTAHTGLEERGIFAAMLAADEFTDTIAELTAEHRSLDQVLAKLDLSADDLADQLAAMARELTEHIDKENNGIFPASVVSLHPQEWQIVERAHGHAHEAGHEHTHPHPHPHTH